MYPSLHSANPADIRTMPQSRQDGDVEPGGRLGAVIRQSGYLRKWLILGIAIGMIADLGAVAFYLALDDTGKVLLGYVGGYDIPKPIGDGGQPGRR